MATAQDLIDGALREIGVLAEGEVSTSSQATDALARLNRYISRLALEGLAIYTNTRTTWTIVSSDGSYTVGTGGDVNIARPSLAQVAEVKYQDTSTDPDTEFSMLKLSEQAYRDITSKDQESTLPSSWYYNPTYPLGTLILWPAPTSSTLQGVIYAWTAVTQLTALSQAISWPDGYEEAILMNLALLLCPSYGRQPHPVLVKTAAESLASVKRANVRPVELGFDPAVLPSGSGAYDIRLG